MVNQLKYFMFFTGYQRVVLSSLSHLMNVNLNYSLCGSFADPFFVPLGKWYFFFSEFYLSLFSYFMKIKVVLFVWVWRGIERVIYKRKDKSE